MLRVRIAPSAFLSVTFTAVHLAAAMIVIPLDLSAYLKAALLAAVGASLADTLWRHALLRCNRSIVEIELHDRCRSAVRMRHGEWVEATVLGTSCVTAPLTVINLKLDRMRFPTHVLLGADNVDSEDFRKIRVMLRCGPRHDPRTQHAGERKA
jgi:hypothetical protein